MCADCTKAFSSFCTILLFERRTLDGHLIHKSYITKSCHRDDERNAIDLEKVFIPMRNCIAKRGLLMFLSPPHQWAGFCFTPSTFLLQYRVIHMKNTLSALRIDNNNLFSIIMIKLRENIQCACLLPRALVCLHRLIIVVVSKCWWIIDYNVNMAFVRLLANNNKIHFISFQITITTMGTLTFKIAGKLATVIRIPVTRSYKIMFIVRDSNR